MMLSSVSPGYENNNTNNESRNLVLESSTKIRLSVFATLKFVHYFLMRME